MTTKLTTLTTVLLLTLSYHSHAAQVWLTADKQGYAPGETITVALKVSDYQTVLTGFYATLSYQPEHMALQNMAFHRGFDDGEGSLQWHKHEQANGILRLNEFSYIEADTTILATNQGDELELAIFTFTAPAKDGEYAITVSAAESGIIDINNKALTLQVQSTEILVVTPEPEPAAEVKSSGGSLPAALLVFISGLALLRRRPRQ